MPRRSITVALMALAVVVALAGGRPPVLGTWRAGQVASALSSAATITGRTAEPSRAKAGDLPTTGAPAVHGLPVGRLDLTPPFAEGRLRLRRSAPPRPGTPLPRPSSRGPPADRPLA